MIRLPLRSTLFPYTTLFRSVMLGTPGETEGDITETLEYCERLCKDFNVIIAPFYFAPLHGTPLFDAFFQERSEEHTSELQSLTNLVCRLLLEKKKRTTNPHS